MRDSFIFYSSFLDCLDELEPEIELEVYRAITHYAIKEEIPELSGVAKAIFCLIKPQIDANNKRYEDGKKGGRPKNENKKTSGFENKKPVVLKNDGNKKPNVNDNVNVNENVNANDNANENENANANANDKDIGSGEPPHTSKKSTKHHYGEYKHVSLTDEEYKKLVQERGQAKTEAAITFLDEYLEMNGKSYKSCYLALRKWVFDALEEKKTSTGQKAVNKVAQQLDDFYTMASEWAERG